ncbi:hypothetical protein Bca52824_066497 [Brassica carinata]|uniref:Uncharacterized protein n=1 Tax=Brassica carinata TaxID=52824 RepID=A0A8X7QKT4_BRACI|nr:hypothetical protein Bca52824_066497 [Brassica carinata]
MCRIQRQHQMTGVSRVAVTSINGFFFKAAVRRLLHGHGRTLKETMAFVYGRISVNVTVVKTCQAEIKVVKGQNLNGSLPKEFAGLPLLQEIDLSRNFLNGSIPPEWGALPLKKLALEFNQISGKLPPDLGNLSNIDRMLLSSNYLTGDIPSTFSKLTTLTDLVIQASGLAGPIPSTIGSLTKLTDLYFTSNMLSREVPDWMVDKGDKIDLTYNDFTNDLRTAECQKNAVNMFSSTSPLVANNHSNVSCLSSYKCPKTFYGRERFALEASLSDMETKEAATAKMSSSYRCFSGTVDVFSS